MSKTRERPRLRRHAIQVRATPAAGEGKFEALVSAYGIPYSVGWGDKEQIEPGCFDESIAANPIIPIFWMHGWNQGLLIGTAAASSNEQGVVAAGEMWLDDPLGLRVWRGMLAEAIREWSVGFYAEAIEYDKDDEYLEHVTKGELIEASSVVRGANPETETISLNALRSILGADPSADGAPLNDRKLLEEIRASLVEIRSGRKNEPAPNGDTTPSPAPASADVLLREPAFRELVRERLSSSADLPSAS